MKIGIVGAGVVGQATARAFIEHVDEVRVYDVVKERRTHSLDDTLEADLIFVCLPTPQCKDGLACDDSYVEDFFHEVATGETSRRLGHRLRCYVLRSTVPIGTTRRLSEKYNLPYLAHSPEFLTARCAVTDAQLPARNIIGWVPGFLDRVFERRIPNELAKDVGRATLSGEPGFGGFYGRLTSLYSRRFPGVPLYSMTSDESEAVKLFQNSFFATKVSFWNECRVLSDKLGLDWNRVMEAILADGRIAHSHTKVPGPDGKAGFGGTCLPKDLANLIDCIQKNGLESWVALAAHSRNLTVDRLRKGSEK